MSRTNKNAPAGFAEPDAGANRINQVQNTPRMYSRQELKDSLVTLAMTIAGLRIGLARKWGDAEAYRMLIKAFQLGCMDAETLHDEGQASKLYFKKEHQA